MYESFCTFLSQWKFNELLKCIDYCFSSNLGNFLPLSLQIFFSISFSPLLWHSHYTHVGTPNDISHFYEAVRFSIFFLFLWLDNLKWPIFKLTNSSVSSNLLLRPYSEFFILITVLFNSLISIWFCYNFSLFPISWNTVTLSFKDGFLQLFEHTYDYFVKFDILSPSQALHAFFPLYRSVSYFISSKFFVENEVFDNILQQL